VAGYFLTGRMKFWEKGDPRRAFYKMPAVIQFSQSPPASPLSHYVHFAFHLLLTGSSLLLPPNLPPGITTTPYILLATDY